MNTSKFLIVLLASIICSNILLAQNKTKTKKEKDPDEPQLGALFKSKEILNFDLLADFKKIKNDRGENTSKHKATVRLVNRSAKTVNIPITLKVRGKFRKATENCSFPPLLMDFDKKADHKAAFKSQNKLKLVTHCSSKSYNEREYLVYELYNIISDESFKARPAQINYIDSSNNKTETYSAFLLEDAEDLGIRKNLKLLDNVRMQHRLIDTTNMAKLALFQFMIGNTDWSLPYMHNIEVYQKDSTTFYAIPYDFDHSGLVNANYANPNPELGITNVRERLYRSISFPKSTLDTVFEHYSTKKAEIIKLYAENKTIDDSYRKYAISYIESFYKELDKPQRLQNIIRATAANNSIN
jgi:hypothetical protein